MSSDARSITIKVKGEALASVNDLKHKHDTRCRKQKSERRFTINPPPFNLPNHVRALALLTLTVPSSSKSPPTTKSKYGEHFVGCCSCGLTSKCSDNRCTYRKVGLSCNACRSKCCRNIIDDTPSSDLPMKTSTDLEDNKSDMTKNAEDHSEECSPIPFRLPSLETISTPTTMKLSPYYRYRK